MVGEVEETVAEPSATPHELPDPNETPETPSQAASTTSAATSTMPANQLPDPWPGRIKGGWPNLDFADCPAELKAHADGSMVQLNDAAGLLIGYGLIDKENRVVRLWPGHSSDVYDEGFFRRRVDRAFDLRRRFRLTGSKAAYRLINSEGDGLSGVVVDVFAGHVIIYTYTSAFDDFVDLLAKAIWAKLKPESIIHKVRPTGETPTGRVAFRLLAGDEPPRQLPVEERGATYEVHPLGGINAGLFCDMRDVRSAVARMSRGLRVLNTFAYTGSFSVVAALNDARSVTTVDFANGVILWAKTNFTHNGLDPADPRFKFVKSDVFDFFKQERRKERGYNFIILDPPTATNVPGRRWYLKSDYDRLIGHALNSLDRFGFLLVAANSQDTRPDGIEQQIKTAARDHDRRLRLIESYGLPPDFPTQIIHPASRHLKCFLLQADV